MDIEHRVKLQIHLRPVGCPWVRIKINDQVQQTQLVSYQEFEYDFVARNNVSISIEHFDKGANDIDTAVEIVAIGFFDIADPKFVWPGTYYPNYPEPWYSQQINKPSESLPGHTYLGWNGIYRLEVSVPVFEWMHKKLDMGWIYR